MQAARRAPLSARAPRAPLLLGLALVVLVADAVTKALVVAGYREPVTVVPHVLTVRLTRNPGAAFGFAGGATVLFSLVAVAVAVAVVRTLPRLRSAGWAVVLGLVLGGALGNLADRLLRAPGPLRGRVVDWIELPHWPVFNLADSAIVCGAVLAFVLAQRGIGLERRAPRRP